jgi:hypothetical protein
MKFDKKSLIEYDLTLYKQQYEQIQQDLKSPNDYNSDHLTKDDLRKWLESGIFVRRLNVRGIDGNIYVTSANINRGQGNVPDLKFGKNDYLYSVWSGNKKVQNLLKRYIGDHEEEDRLKPLDLIGEYKPSEDNLLDIKYETIAGKEFIENARDFLSVKENISSDNAIIDIKSFFGLNYEMVAQGVQAKALYDEQNCIIDGPAGTGKSTIAIQKLKYFYENSTVSQEKCLIIVKNNELKKHFSTLLRDENIDLQYVKIYRLDEVFDVEQIKDYDELILKSKKIKQDISDKINNKNKESLEKHYIHLLNFIGVDFIKEKILELLNDLQNENNINKISKLQKDIENLSLEKKTYLSEQDAYIDEIKKAKRNLVSDLEDETISEDKKLEYKDEIELIEEEIYKYHSQLRDFDKKIQNIQKEIDKLEGKHYKKILDTLTEDTTIPINILDDLSHKLHNTIHGKSIEVLKWLLEYKNYLVNKEKNQKKVADLKAKLQEKISIIEENKIKKDIQDLEKNLEKNYKNANHPYFNKYKEIMEQVYLSKQYLENTNLVNNNLIYKILDIDKKEFDTIIVDEAQDFSAKELELIRLHSERVVLAGDILQNIENNTGLNSWKQLYNKEAYENENGQLNIHSLKHNFRQTYQLANASYNYRQLLLEEKLEDIGSDYFENEKIFNGKEYPKPTLSIFNEKIHFYNYIENKLKAIMGIYTERIPIIVVYKTQEEQNFYTNIFSDYEIAYKKIDKNADIILLELNYIKGEEFPIVLANMNSFSERELYLIMTRAQFELDLFIEHYDDFNSIVYKLIYNDENIKFFDLINIDTTQIKLPNKQNFKEKETLKQSEEQNLEHQKNYLQDQEKDITELDSEEKQKTVKTKEQIIKHKADTSQYDEELDIDIITDEKQYKDEFIKKVQEDIKNFKSNEQNEIIEEIVIVRKKSKTSNDKESKDKIKNYLYDSYKGYCQVCGFTFRKVADRKNSFELFNWNDKRVVKKKKSFITTADSLCLCRNCSANIKWGAFKPVFMNKINTIENFTQKSIDEIKEVICVKLENDIVDKFKDDYEWDDIYALDIMVNNQSKNIYMTNGHLIQFIAYLQLEEGE